MRVMVAPGDGAVCSSVNIKANRNTALIGGEARMSESRTRIPHQHVPRLDCRWELALDGLRPDERVLICRTLSRKQFGARSRIYTAGDPADSLLIVESGRMRWFYSNEAGEEFTLGIWPQGYTTGLISLLLDKPRPVSVETVEPTVILALRRADLLRFMETMPTFAINIARLAASIAGYSMDTTSPLALQSASVRLCQALENLAIVEGDGEKPVIKGLKQEDLASLVGVSRTWITLMLSDLERRGFIWRRRQHIGLLNVEGLRRYCADAGLR